MFGLNKRFTISQQVQTRTEYGGVTNDWMAIAQHVPGTVQSDSDPELLGMYGAASKSLFRFFAEISAPLSVQQHVTDEETGQVYRVLDTKDSAGRGHHHQAILERVE